MELKDVELLKVLQRSHVAAPKSVVAEVKAGNCSELIERMPDISKDAASVYGSFLKDA